MGAEVPQNVGSRQGQELHFFIMGERQAVVNVSFPGAIISQGKLSQGWANPGSQNCLFFVGWGDGGAPMLFLCISIFPRNIARHLENEVNVHNWLWLGIQLCPRTIQKIFKHPGSHTQTLGHKKISQIVSLRLSGVSEK